MGTGFSTEDHCVVCVQCPAEFQDASTAVEEKTSCITQTSGPSTSWLRDFPFLTPLLIKLGETMLALDVSLDSSIPCNHHNCFQNGSRDDLALQWRGQDGLRVILFAHPPAVTSLAFAHRGFCR